MSPGSIIGWGLFYFIAAFNKLSKQRMRVEGRRFEFGVELGAEEKRVSFFREFGDFHETAVGRFAAENQVLLFQVFQYIPDLLPSGGGGVRKSY